MHEKKSKAKPASYEHRQTKVRKAATQKKDAFKTHLEFLNGKPTSSPDACVVFEGRAPDSWTECSASWPRGNGGEFL
jgi:hypothetical protein